MTFPVQPHLRYAETHEWARQEGDLLTIGITAYAQHELGDVVYVELPEPGEVFAAGEAFGSCESVKAVADLKMPVAGEIVAINEELVDHPERVNEDPYGTGWMVRVRPSDAEAWHGLLDADAYTALTAAGG